MLPGPCPESCDASPEADLRLHLHGEAFHKSVKEAVEEWPKGLHRWRYACVQILLEPLCAQAQRQARKLEAVGQEHAKADGQQTRYCNKPPVSSALQRLFKLLCVSEFRRCFPLLNLFDLLHRVDEKGREGRNEAEESEADKADVEVPTRLDGGRLWVLQGAEDVEEDYVREEIRRGPLGDDLDEADASSRQEHPGRILAPSKGLADEEQKELGDGHHHCVPDHQHCAEP
mmetsp:Transcript_64491/g.140409  ORF Transcript_64491/g.140409 Transcript_64491/m.140409 type:complete len:230 (+) Transcript_64491:440-1129(+)